MASNSNSNPAPANTPALTVAQWMAVVAALRVCSPVGGGSPQLFLANQLASQLAFSPEQEQALHKLQGQLVDATVDNYVNWLADCQ